jgi:hypothetical protein
MMMLGGRPVVGFADQACPDNPPPRAGYAVWRGSVPPDLVKWAILLRDHIASFPYGQEWSMRAGTTDVVARKDHHTWTFQKQSDGSIQLVSGICIPGITLYRPIPDDAAAVGDALVFDPATAQPDPRLALYDPSQPPERTDWALVAASGSVLVATVCLFAWGIHAAGRAR